MIPTSEEISRALGVRVTYVRAEPVATGGCHSRIYACRSEIGDLILRVCKGDQGFYTQYFPPLVDPDAWMDQRWAIDQAMSVGLPAPELLYADRPGRWAVMRRLPGMPIHDEYEDWERCPYDEAEFGALLARIHSVRPSGYGPIDDEGRALFSAWQEFLVQAALSALITCVERGALSRSLARRLKTRWLQQVESMHLDRPSLLHMESLGFANIMLDPENRTITGLLDYEDCIGGDPLFEICWMKFYFEYDAPDQLYFDFDRFAEGYGELDLDQERMRLYSAFPFLDKLRWIALESARAGSYVRSLEELISERIV